VTGYPGATNRLRTAAEAEEAVEFTYPHRIAWCDENIALLDQLRLKSEEIKLKATPIWRGLNNYRTKMKGIMDGLVHGGLRAQKDKLDADLQAFLDADPARKAAYGDVIPQIKARVGARRATRAHDAEITLLLRLNHLYDAAHTIVRMAEERPKPDAERDPAYQEREWARLTEAQQELTKRYDRTTDQALFKLALQRMARLPEGERPEMVAAVIGKGEATAERLDKALDALYGQTKLEDEKTRIKLLTTAKLEELRHSKDPILKLALTMAPVHKAIEDRDKGDAGAMLLLRPRYVEALRKMDPRPLAPDANRTLRVTFGTVRGYRPRPEAPVFRPFTTVSEMVQKNKGAWPFDAPGYLLDTVKAKKFGPYVDERLGEVPVDFLSDTDITGGNSGSPTINGRGELVGLAFDGNYEAMASDWLFQPTITRSIHVDLRYVDWLLDAVVPGHALLQEMGLRPAFP
jgi:hypothetical protein